MIPVTLTPLHKNVIVKSINATVQLSPQRVQEIENFWSDLNQNKTFRRGEVFSIDTVTEKEDEYEILLHTTDYAHYMHTVRNFIRDEEGCKVIFGAGLVETADSKFIFGEMASHTAYPGRLQCAGGGLSSEDKVGAHFNMKNSVLREVAEELSIDAGKHVIDCRPVFIKTGGTYDFTVILYHIKVTLSEKELLDNYERFTENLIKNGEQPEFKNIISLVNKKANINSFFEKDNRPREDYLEPFLRAMT